MKQANQEIIQHGTQEINLAIYNHPFPGQDDSFNAHWHQEYEIEYVYSGPVDFLLDGVVHRVQSGDMLFVNKNVIHSCVAPSAYSGRYASIVFGEQFVFSDYGDALYQTYLMPLYEKNMCIPPRLPESMECREAILEHVRALLRCYFEKSYAWEIGIRGHLLSVYYLAVKQRIFTKKVRAETSTTLLVRNAMLLIRQNYTTPLAVSGVANDLGVTPEYLCRVFKAAVGKTPMEFILTCRIEYAQFLLTQSDATVGSIAISCGFDDFNYFSRFFKKCHGISPSAYRAKYRSTQGSDVIQDREKQA